jgi:hypothetical protein
MKRSIVFAYQWAAGISDTLAGVMLIAVPDMTQSLLQLHVPADAMPQLSFIGTFVLAVGLCYIYGARLVGRKGCASRLEAIWLVTAIIRSAVAVYVISGVLGGTLAPGWLVIAVFDGACALIQAIGLRKGWLPNVLR